MPLSDALVHTSRSKSAIRPGSRAIAIAMLAPLVLLALESCAPRANRQVSEVGAPTLPEGMDGRLLSAAALGDIFSVEKLINEGADVNARASNGTTALMGAAYAGYPRTAEYLISRGAQIDAQSADGLTALHYAAGAGHTDIVGRLLDAGADPNMTSGDGTTPLMKATRAGREATVKRLVAGGAVTDSTSESGAILPNF